MLLKEYLLANKGMTSNLTSKVSQGFDGLVSGIKASVDKFNLEQKYKSLSVKLKAESVAFKRAVYAYKQAVKDKKSAKEIKDRADKVEEARKAKEEAEAALAAALVALAAQDPNKSNRNVTWDDDGPDIKVIPGKRTNLIYNVFDDKGKDKFERLDKDLRSLGEFHFRKMREEFIKLKKRERVFNYQRGVEPEIKKYHEDITKLINDLMWLKGVFQSNYEGLQELREIILNKKGGAGRLDGRPKEQRSRGISDVSTIDKAIKTLMYLMDISQNYKGKVEEMINELENIISKLNNRYGIGKGSKSKDVRYYEATLKRLNDSIIRGDYESGEYINACKQVKSFTPYNQNLSGHDDISRNIEAGQKKCNEIAKKKADADKKNKEQIAEDQKNKKKHENEIAAMKKQLDEAQAGKRPGKQSQPSAPPSPQTAPSVPASQPPLAAERGAPGAEPTGRPALSGAPSRAREGRMVGEEVRAGEKSMVDETVSEKLMNINEKQGQDLVIPSKDKLNELSKVMNNDKFLDIIRKKNLGDFTEKEIKDVDIVRDRFNSFVNDYYELLDIFYNYKKNKERGEKEDITILLKQEKQIESLKDIVLEYKTNLEKFKIACEIKVDDEVIKKDKEIEEKDKEFKDVFEYLQGLFKQELKEEKKATNTNTKILKEENNLQKEKILLLEDKKARPKRTPNKKRPPNKKRTPNKKQVVKHKRTPTKKQGHGRWGGNSKKRTPSKKKS